MTERRNDRSLAGEESSGKKRISIQSTTETNISTRRSSVRLGSTRWRSKTTWNEELLYLTKLLEITCVKQGNVLSGRIICFCLLIVFNNL